MRRLTPRDRIEDFFKTAPEDDCHIQMERVHLILELRSFAVVSPAIAKRTRKAKVKEASEATK